ncbi:MAG TPA: hypothetical protein VGG48_01870 [Rhizomicrobium sp.]|jgi:hypothetical protein
MKRYVPALVFALLGIFLLAESFAGHTMIDRNLLALLKVPATLCFLVAGVLALAAKLF